MIQISNIKDYAPLRGAVARKDIYDVEYYIVNKFSMEDVIDLHHMMDDSGLDTITAIIYKTSNTFSSFMSNTTQLYSHVILLDTTSDTIIANSNEYPDVPSHISKKFLIRSDYEEARCLSYIANSIYGLNSTTSKLLKDEQLILSYCIDKYKSRSVFTKLYKYLKLKFSK